MLEAGERAGNSFLLGGVESVRVGCGPGVCSRKEGLEDGALGRVAGAVVGWIGGVLATQVEALSLIVAGAGFGSEVEFPVGPAVDVDASVIRNTAKSKRQSISVALCVEVWGSWGKLDVNVGIIGRLNSDCAERGGEIERHVVFPDVKVRRLERWWT